MSETRQNGAALPPAHEESTLFSSPKQAAHQDPRGTAIAEMPWKALQASAKLRLSPGSRSLQ